MIVDLVFWRYIVGILVALILGMGVKIWVQGVQVDKARNDRDRAQTALVKATDTIKAQQATLQECSDRTDALKAEGDKRAAQAAQELARAQQEASKYQGAIKRLEALKAGPVPSGAKCEAAIQAIRKELRK